MGDQTVATSITHADSSVQRALTEIARRYGTPAYAFDIVRLRAQAEKLRTTLPPDVDVLYSLKANASLGLCDVFAECGLGADVASAGEFATAHSAGFAPERIFVTGPFKSPETIRALQASPQVVVSIDSYSELVHLSECNVTNPCVLRLRPDFGSCAVVQAGSESRFGFTCDQLESCRAFLADCRLEIIGCHVFAGSQVLDTDKLNGHLRRSLELSLRAVETLGIEPQLFNLGGGFGVPYGPDDEPIDLERVAAELAELAERATPAKIVLELGRYLVAEAGWYLTSVLGHQSFQGGRAVIVDGGVHQRADLCGLCLRKNQNPPLVLGEAAGERQPTSILGSLSLPDDVLLESAPLPELHRGDVLAFANAGAYGLWSSPVLFHASPPPAECAFEGEMIHLLRERQPAASILRDQHHVVAQPVIV